MDWRKERQMQILNLRNKFLSSPPSEMSVSSGSDVTIPIQDSPPPPPSPYANRTEGGPGGRSTPEPRGDVTGIENKAYQPESAEKKKKSMDSPGEVKKGHTEINMANGDSSNLNEAVNSELINMNIMNTIPAKPQSEFGPYEQMDDYFIPVNQHKKFLNRRSEKLYVTKDKRKGSSCKKYVCWIFGAFILAAIVAVAVLAGLGILNPASSDSSTSDQFIVTTTPGSMIVSDISISSTPESSSSSLPVHLTPTLPPDTSYIPMGADVEFRITNLHFEAALNDKTSEKFEELSNDVKKQVGEYLKEKANLDNTQIRIVSFLPGSVIVKMRLGWMDESIELESVQRLLATTSNIGTFEVQSTSSYAVVNRCKFSNNDGCSHFCTYDYESLDFLCTCPEMMLLDDDKKQCKNATDEAASPEPEPESEPLPDVSSSPIPTIEQVSAEPSAEPEVPSEDSTASPEPEVIPEEATESPVVSSSVAPEVEASPLPESEASPSPASEAEEASPSPASEAEEASPSPASEAEEASPSPASEAEEASPSPASEAEGSPAPEIEVVPVPSSTSTSTTTGAPRLEDIGIAGDEAEPTNAPSSEDKQSDEEPTEAPVQSDEESQSQVIVGQLSTPSSTTSTSTTEASVLLPVEVPESQPDQSQEQPSPAPEVVAAETTPKPASQSESQEDEGAVVPEISVSSETTPIPAAIESQSQDESSQSGEVAPVPVVPESSETTPKPESREEAHEAMDEHEHQAQSEMINPVDVLAIGTSSTTASTTTTTSAEISTPSTSSTTETPAVIVGESQSEPEEPSSSNLERESAEKLTNNEQTPEEPQAIEVVSATVQPPQSQEQSQESPSSAEASSSNSSERTGRQFAEQMVLPVSQEEETTNPPQVASQENEEDKPKPTPGSGEFMLYSDNQPASGQTSTEPQPEGVMNSGEGAAASSDENVSNGSGGASVETAVIDQPSSAEEASKEREVEEATTFPPHSLHSDIDINYQDNVTNIDENVHSEQVAENDNNEKDSIREESHGETTVLSVEDEQDDDEIDTRPNRDHRETSEVSVDTDTTISPVVFDESGDSPGVTSQPSSESEEKKSEEVSTSTSTPTPSTSTSTAASNETTSSSTTTTSSLLLKAISTASESAESNGSAPNYDNESENHLR